MTEIVFNADVLNDLQNATLDGAVTHITFPPPPGDASETGYRDYIQAITEGLSLLKDNTQVTELHFGRMLRNPDDSSMVTQLLGAVGECIAANASVTSLTLDNNDIRPEGVVALAEGLKQNGTLQSLSLNHGYMGDTGAAALAGALQDNTALVSLSLSHNHIKPAGGIALAEALKGNNALTSLDVRGNALGDTGFKAIAALLGENASITVVKHDFKEEAGIRAINEALGRNKYKTELSKLIEGIRSNKESHLGMPQSNAFNAPDYWAVTEELKANTSIKQVDLSKDADAGIRILAEGLAAHKGIRVIWLYNNADFGPEGAKALANAVRQQSNLYSLDIMDCPNTGSEGIREIINAINIPQGLKSIEFQKMPQIGTDEALLLAEALRNQQHLETVKIIDCPNIGAEGAKAILAALETLPVETLVMKNAGIDTEATKSLEWLKHNQALTSLDIRRNTLGKAGLNTLTQALEVNDTLRSLVINDCADGTWKGNAGATIKNLLQKNHTLEILEIEDNKLDSLDTKHIAEGLAANKGLQILKLGSSNRITARNHPGANKHNTLDYNSASSFGDALSRNNSLCVLEIDQSFEPHHLSKIMSHLADGLRHNRTLAELSAYPYEEEGQQAPKLTAQVKEKLNSAIAASGTRNLITLTPYISNDTIYANSQVVDSLSGKVRRAPHALAPEDIRECEGRMPAFLSRWPSSKNTIIENIETRKLEIAEEEKQRALASALQLRRETNERVIKDIANYAGHNGLNFEQMCIQVAESGADTRYTATAGAFNRLINGDYGLKDMDTLLAHGGDTPSDPALKALKQFVNHSLIPHLDYFLIQAMKTEDLSQVNSQDYPHIMRVGNKPVLEAGIHQPVSSDIPDVVDRIEQEKITAPSLSFIADPRQGTIRERFDKAWDSVDETVGEFDKAISSTRNRIIAIITETPEREKDKQITEAEIKQLNQFNAGVGNNLRMLEQTREDRKALGEANISNTNAINKMGAWGGIVQLINGISLMEPISIMGGLAALRGSAARSSATESNLSKELERIERRIENEESKFKDTRGLERKLNEIVTALEELRKDEDFQKNYLPAVKQEAVQEAYIAKIILDVGKENLRSIEKLCKSSDFSSVDEWIVGLEPRLGQAITNFCFGYADSNDMKVIIADANAIPGEGSNESQKILKKLVERKIKNNIEEYYAHAAQVDKIYQANLTSLGTDFYEARQMVQREHDKMLAALFSYPQKTYPELMEDVYSARGALDVRRVFDYWQHRHGDTLVDNNPIRYERKVSNPDGTTQIEREPRKEFAKMVSIVRKENYQSFEELVKKSFIKGSEAVPSIGNDYLRLCAYEYMHPQLGDVKIADNPITLVSYPPINSTINTFISNMCFDGIDDYKSKIGNRLDNLIAQTFIDFFAEMGERHSNDKNVMTSIKRLDTARTTPTLGKLAFSDHTETLEEEFHQQYPLFLKIYTRNLEKMLEVVKTDDKDLLVNQIQEICAVRENQPKPDDITLAKLTARRRQLKPEDITLPGSERAQQRARYANHSYENTKWSIGR